jgi:hypothetical protein|mmetsp:Transcript_21509/g.34814  ORF Transcript_21509/g.34814 Transcript_21509/m.34814 type:complete len:92 (-) Transcript_21509:785-1060(-)
MAWPRSGQLSQETLDKISTAVAAAAAGAEGDVDGTAGDAASAPASTLRDLGLEQAAKEVGAITNALQHLIENYDGIFQSDSFSLDDDEMDD